MNVKTLEQYLRLNITSNFRESDVRNKKNICTLHSEQPIQQVKQAMPSLESNIKKMSVTRKSLQ